MSMSSKEQILHYLQFLKSSGFLYLEPDRPGANGNAANLSADVPPSGANDFVAEAKTSYEDPRLKQESPNVESPNVILPPAPAERDRHVAQIAAAMARAERCRACALGATRDKLVYGDGDPLARIVFVGEAPGAEENATGIPFVGRAGQLLNKMIAAIGFKREEVYICNTLKCRPPDNRDPLPTEKAACEAFLVEQLEILRPQILVALGAHAAQYLCRKEMPIGKLRGRWYEYHGIALLATFHPAFLLRNGNYKSQSWDDFQMIHKKYCELNPGDAREIWRKKE